MRNIWLLLIVMLLGFRLVACADPPATGQVTGTDSTNPGTWVIQMPAELKVTPRDIVRIERNGTLVTEATVMQVQVDRITVHPKDPKAAVQEGDTVVYVGPPVASAAVPGGGTYAPPKPKTLQPGLHVNVTLIQTFTNDAGYWACTAMAENVGDEDALVRVSATFTAQNDRKSGFTDINGTRMKPGETHICTIASNLKSPYGTHNDTSEHQGVTGSNFSVGGSDVSNEITSVTVELSPTFFSLGKH